jgi:ribose 5-phosphate isomerase A
LTFSSKGKKEETMELVGLEVARKHIKSGMIIGLGSGSAVAKFARALGEEIRAGHIKELSVIPSSMQAFFLAKENDLPLNTDTAHCPRSLDAAVDGADQVSLATRSMIKGGGGALLKEKIILSSSKHSYILVDSSKIAQKLTRSVPVEVVQFATISAGEIIRKECNGETVLRTLDKGYPHYTESGNVILDCQFKEPIDDPIELERSIKSVAGVVEAGIFNCQIDKFYVGTDDGRVESH